MLTHLPNDELCPVERLKPYANNARTHSKQQIDQIAASIQRFGFTNPVLVGDDLTILAGHGRVAAAIQLGIGEVPVRRLSHLNDAEKRAYILADNKLAENAGWDRDLLAIELQGLIDLDFDIDVIGFDTAEIDLLFDEQTEGDDPQTARWEEIPPASEEPPVTRVGDLWQLGSHRLLCGDAKSASDLDRLCADTTIELLFTDPPYNVPIDGHVSGLGKHRHREFVEASGEMSEEAFVGFLTSTLGNAARHLKDGAIAYVCMDWRHMREVLSAGDAAFDELKNLCIWNKTNGGMGSFYRSKHELVFVYKKGRAAHINNFGLGEKGRYRTNVWDYAGISSMGANREEELAMHPTVKPVVMIADALFDCSHRNGHVLDIFGGSGSTLMAAERTGRIAHLMELDPVYCDTIIHRFEKVTGRKAVLDGDGRTFGEVADERRGKPPGGREASIAPNDASSDPAIDPPALSTPQPEASTPTTKSSQHKTEATQ